MKGILRRTEKGWVVEYESIHEMCEEAPFPALHQKMQLPLHPDDVQYAEEGKRVEFHIPMGSDMAELVIEDEEQQESWDDIEEKFYKWWPGNEGDDKLQDFKFFVTQFYNPPTPKTK